MNRVTQTSLLVLHQAQLTSDIYRIDRYNVFS